MRFPRLRHPLPRRAPTRARAALAAAVALIWLLAPEGAAATNPPARVFEFPVSTFVFDTNNPATRDPFFPTSTRWHAKVATPGQTNEVPQVQPTLQLRGITGPPERRIALINNRTFEKGETAEVRVTDKMRLVIQVADIGEGSVTITYTLDGQRERKELKLEGKPLSLVPEEEEGGP